MIFQVHQRRSQLPESNRESGGWVNPEALTSSGKQRKDCRGCYGDDELRKHLKSTATDFCRICFIPLLGAAIGILDNNMSVEWQKFTKATVLRQCSSHGFSTTKLWLWKLRPSMGWDAHCVLAGSETPHWLPTGNDVGVKVVGNWKVFKTKINWPLSFAQRLRSPPSSNSDPNLLLKA